MKNTVSARRSTTWMLCSTMHRACVSAQGAGEKIKDRGLAGPVGTDKRSNLAALQLEIELTARRDAAEAFREIAHLEDDG
jgi:predicted small secreted protein